MLKKLFSYVLIIAMTVLLGGCDVENVSTPEIPSHGEKGNLKLTFRSARTSTRAADDSNNENLITSLHIFLYTKDADPEESEPVVYKSFSGLEDNTVSEINMSLRKQQTVDLFGSDQEEGTCRLVAIANLPEGTELPASMTINNLRQLEYNSQLHSQSGDKAQESFLMFGDTEEERSGNVVVKFTPDDLGGTAEGNVMLVRAAARITLNVQVPETLTITEEGDDETATEVVWTSQRESMQILLDNGVSISTVDPSILTDRPADDSYFSIGAGKGYTFENSGATGEDAYPWVAKMPFYTLPNRWEVTASETHRTSLTLIVPWKKGDEQSYRTCYYKVPITAATELLRNTAYTVNLKVSMLGSFTNDEPLEVEPSYLTVDWGEVNTAVDIKNYRYLVLNQNSYVAENTATIDIPFYSSHDVTVSDVSMTYQRFNMYGNNSEVMDITISEDQNKRTEEVTGEKIFSYELASDAMGNNVLRINHPLTAWTPYRTNGNREIEVDYIGYGNKAAAETAIRNIEYYRKDNNANAVVYSPYIIKATLHHIDKATNSTFSETITVTQYPGMWILADKNSGTGASNPSTNADYGYVWVNNTRNTLGRVQGLTGTNKNPNMYVITINVLDTDQQGYIIDDPRYYSVINLNDNTYQENGYNYYYLTHRRSNNTNNLNYDIVAPTTDTQITALSTNATWSNSATASYEPGTNGQRQLKYYYPTNESQEFSNVIAPKIRVASSYGVTSKINRNDARRRCASYQEDGRPAGRWRLPTLGEMQFIVNLSRTGKIPVLFSDETTYLSAQGWVEVPSASTTNVTLSVTNADLNSTNYVRCVYDEWYWSRFTPVTVDKNTFTWGDRPKINPEGTN
ncbi:MAG: hypothetical protein K2N48_12370 [Muribaculaceae bacterium]|nr:hypothetical protein [Muribaculaceae bacterium]